MYSLIAVVAVLSACENSDIEKSKEPSPDDECLTVRGLNNGKVIDGQYIIAVNQTETSNGRMEDITRSIISRNKLDDERILRVSDGTLRSMVMKLSKAEANALSEDDDVLFIEQDRVVSICACFTVIEPRSITWSVEKVGFDNGTGKTAWIVDTGIDLDHPDLNVDKVRSKSFIDSQSSANDENGHGTHVAGIIGALNNRVGLMGVASGATLVGLKVLDTEGEGLMSTVIAALAYIRRNAKPGDVVNLSLGVDKTSSILDREIQGLANSGIYFAIAAGNDGKPARNYSPARVSGENIYTVSAIDSLGRFARFSNYGSDVVDYAAPGVRIISSYKNGRYAVMSGTSMAAPHVAGLLLISNGKLRTSGFAVNDPDNQPDPLAHW